MATGSLYGSVSESTGLYGIGAASGGTYFEWFIFQDSATAPATPTGGSWSFSTNTGTAPTGWLNAPPAAPVNQVWVSITIVDSRNAATFTWSVPGLMTGSGLPILSASGVPASGTGLNGQLYIDTATTPQSLYFKQSGAWTQLTGSNLVDLINNQTIGGVKTFTQTIQGDISGTAGNVSGVVAVANGGTGASTAANARTNLGLGTIATQDASAVAITGGSITGITDLAVADGGTGASSASVARTNLGAVGLSDTQTLTNKTISGASNTLTNIPNASLDNDSVNVNGVDLTLGAVQLLGPDWILPSYAGNAGKVLAVNLSSSDVQWIAGGGVGSVTSIDVSGGTTGLTTSGGPITAAGVITLDGTLGIANGGTGQTTANAAFNALAPSQTSNSGKFLTTNGTDASWVTITGTISYQGTWNASTNTPTITSGVGVNGYYYVVSVAGSTNIDGITDWQIGDWLIFNGTAWQKIDQSNTVTSVAGRTGAVVLTTADIGGLGTIATQNANAVAITGGTATLTSLTVNDNTTLGSSNTDEVNFNARIASEFTPSTANTYDLGRNSHEWRNLYLTGTANISALTASGTVTLNGGTANGVAYLNGSKVLTTGSALTFDGTNLGVGGASPSVARAGVYADANGRGVAVFGRSADNASTVDFYNNAGTTRYGFVYADAGGVEVGATAGLPAKFLANGSEQMRLTSTGLGIGTSSPSAALDVTALGTAGTATLIEGANLEGAIRFRVNTDSYNGIMSLFDSGSNEDIRLSSLNAANSWINNGGNVGIGTSSPASKLDVYSTGNTTLTISGSSGTGGDVSEIDFLRIGSGVTSSIKAIRDGANNSGALTFYTANFGTNTERMRIDSSGNVGIGTSSPGERLVVANATGSVAAQILASATGSSNLYFADGTTGADNYTGFIQYNHSTNAMNFGTNGGTTRATITSSGNVGIGTSSPNASAILDAQSTTKGVRMPNMTTTQKNAIASPAAGLMVFDTTLSKLCVYTGAAWETITSI